MKKEKIFAGILVILLIVATVSFAGEWKETEISKHVPLPPRIEIIPPAADLPPEISAFSGRWESTYDNYNIDFILVVTKISRDRKAKIIMGMSGGRTKDYTTAPAEVIPGPKSKLEFVSGGSHFSFEMQEDLKTIKGTRHKRGSPVGIVTMTLDKIED